MCTIHIGIGHNDDLVIPQFADIKVFMDTGTESRDHRLDFFIRIDLIQSCLFHIQDLTAQRQDSLGRTASCGFCASACGITLYDIDLTVSRILIRTVCQFTGQGCAIQRTLSMGQISCLTGRFPCTLC